MYSKRFCFVVGAAVALAVVMGAMGGAALAEQPGPQTRYFAYLLPAGSECPDLEDPESVALVAHSGQGSNMWIEMWAGLDESQPLPLGGTSWFTGDTVVTHVAKGGAQKYDFFWEDATPPNGTVANTGADGDAVFIATYRIRNVTTMEDMWAHPNLWRVDETSGSGPILCVGVGLFSK